MSTEKTEAIVIRQADFSESSRVVTLFTRDFGKISTVAKGGRRLKGPFESALDLLAVCRIVFLRKSSAALDLLTEAQLISRFRPGGGDLVGLYGGYYLAELLADLTAEYDPHPVVFDQAVETLRGLADPTTPGTRPRETLLRFEVLLLREFGHLPVFDECIVCGEPVSRARSYVFWVSQGGLICGNCRKENYSQQPIQPGTVELLKRLAAANDSSGERLGISDQQLNELRRIVTSIITHILGRRPKLYRYLQLPFGDER